MSDSQVEKLPASVIALREVAASLSKWINIDEIKSLHDKAEVARLYGLKVGAGEEAIGVATEIRNRAERRLGEVLSEIPKQAGARGTGKKVEYHEATPLSDLGINKLESSRAQAIASIPEEDFERSARATKTDLYKKGKTHQRKEKKREALSETPGLESSDWQIFQGDCIECLKGLPEGRVRLVFADPPYNIGINYGDHYNDKRDPEEFAEWCREWIWACRLSLTPDGSFWLLMPHRWAADLWQICRESGFHLRQWITWYESFGVNATRMFNLCSRSLLWMTRDDRNFVFNQDALEIRRESDRQLKYNDSRANPDGKLWDDVWGINPPIPRLTGTCKERMPDFPTQLPLALLRPIIACATEPGDLVLDPFSGSGTTGAACIELGRRFVGTELSEEFSTLSRKRLSLLSGDQDGVVARKRA